MSRDFTPKELYLTYKSLEKEGNLPLIDVMRSATITYNGDTSLMYSTEEIQHRENYPLLGTLLDPFNEVYLPLSKLDGGLYLLDQLEKTLKRYIETGEGDRDTPLIQWYEGRLDNSFYYCNRNNQLLIESILDDASTFAPLKTNEPEKLYRFELAFDFIPQYVGFLQGLADTSIDETTREEIYDMFASLPAPQLETPDDSKVECWFREEGLMRFRHVLNDLIYELSLENWQLLGQEISMPLDGAIYTDAYQAAFPATYLETDKTRYGEITTILDSEPHIMPRTEYAGLTQQIQDARQKAFLQTEDRQSRGEGIERG